MKGTHAFVAVVVGKRVMAGKQQVLAYVCDSRRIAERKVRAEAPRAPA